MSDKKSDEANVAKTGTTLTTGSLSNPRPDPNQPTTLTATSPVPKKENENKTEGPNVPKPTSKTPVPPPVKSDTKKKKGLGKRLADAWRTKKPDADTHKEKKFDDIGSILKMLFDILFGAPKTLKGLGIEALRLPLTIPLAIGGTIVSAVSKPLQVLGKGIKLLTGNETLLNKTNTALNFAEILTGRKPTHPEGSAKKEDTPSTPPKVNPEDDKQKQKSEGLKPGSPEDEKQKQEVSKPVVPKPDETANPETPKPDGVAEKLRNVQDNLNKPQPEPTPSSSNMFHERNQKKGTEPSPVPEPSISSEDAKKKSTIPTNNPPRLD